MSPELRILAYLPQFPPPHNGGSYYYNYHLFKELQRAGCAITILSHAEAKIPLGDGIELISIKSIKTPRFVYRHSVAKLVDLVSNILIMSKHISLAKYDFIFSDAGYLQNLTVFIANLMTRIPVIGLNHGEEINSLQNTTRLRSWCQRRLLQSHCVNISNTRFTRDLILACGVKKPVIVIYPLINEKTARDKAADRKLLVNTYGLDADSLIVGFLGRHTLRKGPVNLIGAVEALLQENKQLVLLIAGQGGDTDRVKDRISRSEHPSQFKMIDVPPGESKDCFFNGIDIFAMPNYEDLLTGDTEGFGIVFIEAAQYGTPVIGGNAGGVVEALCHQYNGLLVDGRSVDSIAEAIRFYYQNPFLRELHGQNGREWAKQFVKVESLTSLVETLIEERNSRS